MYILPQFKEQPSALVVVILYLILRSTIYNPSKTFWKYVLSLG